MPLFLFVLIATMSGSVFGENCGQTALAIRIKDFIQEKFAYPSHGDFGLPETNLTAKLVRLHGDRVRLISDLGASEWWPKELIAWRKLDQYIEHPKRAKREIDRIVSESNHCTPGLTPAFCAAVRTSHAIHLELVQDMFGAPAGEFTLDLDVVPSFIRRLRQRHEERAAVRFAFGTSVEYLMSEMEPDAAVDTFRLAAREALVQRLTIDSVTELPFASRMLIAAAPMLAPMAPLLARRSHEGPPSFSFGDFRHGSESNILAFDWPAARTLNPKLYVSFDVEQPPAHAISVYVRTTPEHALDAKADRRVLARHVRETLADLAHEFREKMDLRQKIHVETDWHEEKLVVRLKGIGRLQQIIFYDYAAEKLVPQRG